MGAPVRITDKNMAITRGDRSDLCWGAARIVNDETGETIATILRSDGDTVVLVGHGYTTEPAGRT